LAASQAKQSSKVAGNQLARPHTPENSIDDGVMPNMPPLAGESQGDTTIALTLQTAEHLQGPPKLIPTLASVP
jgi:hypothetical protein